MPLARQGLWVIATPLGNLDDLTVRARQALESADAILCEDTRRTRNLLSALGIRTRTERLDAHASEALIHRAVDRMRVGVTLALVTDAGTPAISDPGAALVARALSAGVVVTPFPGPSAVPALLSVSGFGEPSFTFRGFFPRKPRERDREILLCRSSEVSRVFVWFESPERVLEALRSLARAAPDSEVRAVKEMTKVHERLFAGLAEAVVSDVERELEEQGIRGEWTLAARFHPQPALSEAGRSWEGAVECLIRAGVSASEAARQVSQVFGASKNAVYELALKRAGKK